MDKLHQELRQQYDEQEKIYLEKFGSSSLEYVSLWEPQDYPDSWQEILPEATAELKKAVETEVAIEPDQENVIY